MGGTSEAATAKVGPWPLGVDNVSPEDGLPTNPDTGAVLALREAVNVDLDNEGWPSRREGTTNLVAAGRAHSMFGGVEHLFAVVDGDLNAYDVDLNLAATVKASIGDRYASFAQVNEDIFWSNGVVFRRIDQYLGDHPAGLEVPPPPTVAASNDGGLAAGDYMVCLTQCDDDGRESGACPATLVTVPEGGGIALTNLPAAGEDVVETRVYCTAPDGEAMYLVAKLSPAQPMLYLGAFTQGKLLETAWLLPLPPGQIVRFWNGRVLVAAQNMLCWSEALRFGLMHQDSTLRFGATITLMETVGEGGDGSGVFVADHKRTYFMEGDSPDKWRRVIRYPHPAVPGTSLTLPGTALGFETTAPVAFWLASNGTFVVGLPGGKVVPISEGRHVVDAGDHGAVAFRETNGLRQLIASFFTGDAQRLGVTDSASATIRRHGVTID